MHSLIIPIIGSRAVRPTMPWHVRSEIICVPNLRKYILRRRAILFTYDSARDAVLDHHHAALRCSQPMRQRRPTKAAPAFLTQGMLGPYSWSNGTCKSVAVSSIPYRRKIDWHYLRRTRATKPFVCRPAKNVIKCLTRCVGLTLPLK
jgi:hypothetical protein